MFLFLFLFLIEETIPYSYRGEIKFYQNIQGRTINEKSIKYFSKNGNIRLEEDDDNFFILGPKENIYIMSDIDVNLFFDRTFFPQNKEMARLLMPGYVWDQVKNIPQEDGDWEKEDLVIDDVDILSVFNSEDSWEKNGVKTTYWLHKEYQLPIRRERVKEQSEKLIDVIEINIEEENLEEGVFFPPKQHVDYIISKFSKSLSHKFFVPEKILGAKKQEAIFLSTKAAEEGGIKGLFLRYLSEEKDSYVYLIYFEDQTRNQNFRILKKALDLDLEGWAAMLPQTQKGWSVRVLSNYPKPTLLKHLKMLWNENQSTDSGG